MNSNYTLPQLGWQPFFQQQLTLDDYQDAHMGRVINHHRSGYEIQTEQQTFHLAIHANLPTMTVGDWLVLDHQQQFVRLLDRSSLFKRKAVGNRSLEQYIAANIDTAFIVCSLNDDFNLSRIERYLAIAHEAQVEAVVVLTKADLCTDVVEKRQQVQKLDPLLMIEVVNGLEATSVEPLLSWCRLRKTVVFLGSSGVGKSTLVNTLIGEQTQKTAAIREDDSKGRHTTTARSLHFLPSGGLLLDTPGMRELQLTDCEQGVSETFSDVEALIAQCRFSDCQHQEQQPGCAVQAALTEGRIESRRLNNYLKLLREQQRNSASIAEQRATDKAFSKMVHTVMSGKQADKLRC